MEMKRLSGSVTVTQKAADFIADHEDFTQIDGFKGLFIRHTENGVEMAVLSPKSTALLSIA